MILVISNWEIFEIYQSQYNPRKSITRIYTESPSVYERLRHKYDVIDLSSMANLEDVNSIGIKVFKQGEKWQAIINNLCHIVAPNMDFGNILGRGLPMLMNSLVYHYFLLSKLIEHEDGSIVVPYLSDDVKNSIDCNKITNLQPMQTNWYGLLARSACFNKIKALPLQNDRLFAVNKREKSTFSSILPSVILKYINVNSFFFQKQLLKYNFLISTYNIFLAKNKKTIVNIFLKNDLIYSLLGGMLRKQHRLRDVKKINVKDIRINNNKYIELYPALIETVDKDFLGPLSIAAKRVECYINNVLFPAYKYLKDNPSKRGNESNVKEILLTNSLGDPLEVLQAYFIRLNGIPIIGTQHGATGLLKQYDYIQHYSSMARCDWFICFNKHEINHYIERTQLPSKNIFFVYGTYRQHLTHFSYLQRHIVRNMWSIRSREKVVLYLPTRFKEGRIIPFDIYDMRYWFFLKDIAVNLLANNNSLNIIKIHQKGLISYKEKTMYKKRQNPWFDIELPKNIKIKSYPQLNYCRYVADILIIDRATSTLEWAISANIPLIYIDNPHSPLLPDIKNKMSESVFLVDAHHDGWKRELLEYTNMDYIKVQEEWDSMKINRDNFISNYVFATDKNNNSVISSILDIDLLL